MRGVHTLWPVHNEDSRLDTCRVFGLEHNSTLVTFLYAAVVFGVAIVVGRITQVIVLGGVHAFARRWNSQTYKALTSVRFFHKLCRLIPAMSFLF